VPELKEDGPMVCRVGIVCVLAVVLVVIPTHSRSAEPPKAIDYARDVKPIFAKHCISCHGAEKQKSGLRLDQKAAALAGGDSGKAIVPG
jgi:mono/diheme cytochrome c family protein